MLGRFMALVRAPFRRGALDREIDDEFALHLELRAADLERQGLPRAEAVRRARMEFGNVTRAAERARAVRRTEWIDRLSQDVRYAARGMRRHSTFSAVAVLSLAFGIGAATSVFSVIDALDFRPLQFHHADRLVWLAEVTPPGYEGCSRCDWFTAPPTMVDWKKQAGSFVDVAAVRSDEFVWQHDAVSEALTAQRVTPGFFALLGSRTIFGRGFAASDTAAGAEPVVVVSYEFWQARLHADPGRRRAPRRAGRTARRDDHRRAAARCSIRARDAGLAPAFSGRASTPHRARIGRDRAAAPDGDARIGERGAGDDLEAARQRVSG